MSGLSIVRAAHLLLYVEIFREIGVPVDRELGRSRLPPAIEETPDAYVSLPIALDWIARCGRDASMMEFGYLAARRSTPATLSREVRDAILAAPTAMSQLQALARLAHRENSGVEVRVAREGSQIRITCDVPDLRSHAFIAFAEWLNLQALVALVRSTAGPAWSPTELTFVSSSRPSKAALEAYGDTRILVGQPRSSVLMAADVLARSCPPTSPGSAPAGAGAPWDFASALRSAIRPYLGDDRLGLTLAAELTRMSPRSLQRRLEACGRTYSDVVQEARFDLARDLLADVSLKIIDVAFAAGYDNPQHFSRAFRRVTGLTPKAYRLATIAAGPGR